MILHLLHPLVLMRMGPKPAGGRLIPLYTPDALDRLPQILRDAMDGAEHSLVRRGFAPPFRAVNNLGPNIRSAVSLVEHPDDKTLGFIMITLANSGRASIMATFSTEFSDGWTLMTSNSTSQLRTPSRPKIDSARLMTIHDIGDLYDIHRRRVADRAKTARVIGGTRGGDPVAYQDREAREIQSFWIKKGYYRRVDGDRIKLTTLGAILSAWRGLFPWKQLTANEEQRKAQEVLRQYAV